MLCIIVIVFDMCFIVIVFGIYLFLYMVWSSVEEQHTAPPLRLTPAVDLSQKWL